MSTKNNDESMMKGMSAFSDAITDDIIKRGIVKNTEQLAGHLIYNAENKSLNSYPQVDFDKLKAGIDLAIKKENKNNGKSAGKAMRIAAVAAVVAILIVGCMSVDAIRVYFYKTIVSITGDYMQISIGQDTKVYTEDKKDAEEVYKSLKEKCKSVTMVIPKWLPQNTVMSEGSYYESPEAVELLYNLNGIILRIHQSSIEDKQENINLVLKGNTVSTKTIHMMGNDITYVKLKLETGNIVQTAMWGDNHTSYAVDFISDDEGMFMKILNNLKLY